MWTARVHKYRQVLNYRKNDDNPSTLVALLANTGFLFKKAGTLPDGIISVIKISYKFIKSWAMMILGKLKGKVWWTTDTSNSRKSLDGKTVRIFIPRIQGRASSQTKGLERSWKQRARLTGLTGVWGSRAWRLRLLRYA